MYDPIYITSCKGETVWKANKFVSVGVRVGKNY